MIETGHKCRVVILGGYGVFGGRLAQLLMRSPAFEVVVAGRRLEKAKAFCARHGGRPAQLDSQQADFPEQLEKLAPFITVDAAGPFQTMKGDRYRLVSAALAAGSHYLDLSDDANFTSGIKRFDEAASDLGLVVLSGVSTVPALSSAAVEHLKPAFGEIDLIETAILPGNRAPRGLSVMEAILSQTGKPITVTRDGRQDQVVGWSGLCRQTLAMPGATAPLRRWACFIGAPDLALFPGHYNARTVLFRAGVELSIMHLGLWTLGWLVRTRLVRSLVPAARLLRWLAGWLEPFGSDRGGMYVRLAGLDHDSRPLSRRWTLIAEAGDGPHIPAVAAAIMSEKIRSGASSPGARACLGEFVVEDFKHAVSHLAITTDATDETRRTLFQQALGPAFADLPASVQALHTVFDHRSWHGRARVTRGGSWLSKLVCALIGFPPANDDVLVTVTIERRGEREVWRRKFGEKTFHSELSLRARGGLGHIRERFGWMRFDIDLAREGQKLTFPVSRGTLLGVPFPAWLLPASNASETEEDGRFRFDVDLSLPGIGNLVRYQGWLEPHAPYAASREKMHVSSEGQ